jgi:hypothetical protein
MKILVEFIRAEQHWMPDTGSQQNYLVFGFGGQEHRVLCEEADIINAIREAQALGVTPGPTTRAVNVSGAPSDDEEDDLEHEMFSGPEDVAVNPPVMFENPTEDVVASRPNQQQSSESLRKELIAKGLDARPRTKAKIAEEKEARRREIARRAPMRTLEVDDVGNPVVPANHQVNGPAPTVRMLERPEIQDDDPFRQG